jgi:hypothetical protein
VPCGISDKAVGSVAQQLAWQQLQQQQHNSTSDFKGDIVQTFLEGSLHASSPTNSELLLEYRYALLEAFEEVFGLELEQMDAADLDVLCDASKT